MDGIDWRKFMIKRFFAGLGTVILTIFKGIAWVVIHALYLILELAKLFLLLFGLIARIFLAFVRAGTP